MFRLHMHPRRKTAGQDENLVWVYTSEFDAPYEFAYALMLETGDVVGVRGYPEDMSDAYPKGKDGRRNGHDDMVHISREKFESLENHALLVESLKTLRERAVENDLWASNPPFNHLSNAYGHDEITCLYVSERIRKDGAEWLNAAR